MESDHPTHRNDNQSTPSEDLVEPRHTHEADLVIPNPPEGGIVSEIPNSGPRTATSMTELLTYLNGSAEQNGFAIIKRQAGNKRKATGEYTRWYLYCDRDAVRASESVGHRNTTTQKNDCPWKGIATSKKDNNWGWTWSLCPGHELHNHGPSLHPDAHTTHRKLSESQKDMLKVISRLSYLRVKRWH